MRIAVKDAPALRQPRRGVTALEYLAVISLILVVLILGVQHVGSVTGALFQKSADATTAKP